MDKYQHGEKVVINLSLQIWTKLGLEGGKKNNPEM